jgi:hypothetical protein
MTWQQAGPDFECKPNWGIVHAGLKAALQEVVLEWFEIAQVERAYYPVKIPMDVFNALTDTDNLFQGIQSYIPVTVQGQVLIFLPNRHK